MAENTDIPGLDGLVSAITGEEPSGPSLAASTASFVGAGNRPPSSADSSIFSSIFSTLTGGGGGAITALLGLLLMGGGGGVGGMSC